MIKLFHYLLAFIFGLLMACENAKPTSPEESPLEEAESLRTASGMPELHQAVMDNQIDKVEAMLKNGADVNQLDPQMGNAPLHIAAQCDSPEMIALLLAHGAFVNLHTPRAGHTPLMVACWYSKGENMRALLKAEDINIYARSPHGGAMAKNMIGGGDKNPDKNDVARNTALLKILADYEAELNQRIADQEIYQVVIDQELSLKEKENKVKALINSGAPVNTESMVIGSGNDRHSALLVASRENYPNIVEMLLEAGADIGQRGYMMNAIPFHKAAYKGNPEVTRLLVQHPDAMRFINDQGLNNGYTPLHDAIWHGNTASAKILVEAGARLDLKNYEGDTPLDLARRYQYEDIIKFIEAFQSK
ncbi:ankyrin repeat domain-containing protein [Persicobacter sp. CCB-QB2]|uniref:ankyrin repeat domain-containing protein n=1 Tax=Persicobacter sp. CCB-QB2 TaxID=1561025 RepID=UPI0006A9B5DB|nr:ankyrin repeat domain-containing protein [Persicobacter sp. CCB-QB2]